MINNKTQPELKTRKIPIMVEPSLWDRISNAAHDARQTRSEYIRGAVIERMERDAKAVALEAAEMEGSKIESSVVFKRDEFKFLTAAGGWTKDPRLTARMSLREAKYQSQVVGGGKAKAYPACAFDIEP